MKLFLFNKRSIHGLTAASVIFLCFNIKVIYYREARPVNIPFSDSLFVKFTFADTTLAGLHSEEYFFELLKTDFKKRNDRQKNKYTPVRYFQDTGSYGYRLTVEFSGFKMGDVKTEQSSRLASITVSKTTHDKELMEHKVGSVNDRTEIVRIKKMMDSKLNIHIIIADAASNNELLNKQFSGGYNWQTEFVTYNGKEELLTREEKNLAKDGEKPPPTPKQTVKKLLEEVYKEISTEFNSFFSRKKGF